MTKLLRMVLVGSVVTTGFIGCGLVDPTSGPTCDFKSVAVSGDVAAGGGAVKVTGILDGSAEISAVTVTVTTSAGAATTGFTTPYNAVKKQKLNLESDLDLKISAAASVPAAAYKLVITATVDGSDFSTTVSFNVTGQAGTVLTEKMGMIANIEGPDTGSYDLVNGKRIAASGAPGVKDLMDMSLAGAGFSGKVTSGNGTVFAVATASDYTGATDVSVKALAATASLTEVSVSAVGTVFVAKLGSSRGYAIVKVTRYDATAGSSSGANKGEMEFAYKFTN